MSFLLNSYRHASAAPAFGGASRHWDTADGDQYGIISSPPSELDLVGGDFSVAFWFKDQDGNGFPRIIEFNNSNSNVWSVYRITSTAMAMRVDEAGSLVLRTRHTDNLLSTPNGTTWHHVIATFESTTPQIDFYIDNGSAASTTGDTANRGSTSRVTFGIRTDLNNQTDGLIKVADLRVYNKLLSSQERTDIYNGTHVSDSLVGWWFLDTDDMDDYSGNDNHISQSSTAVAFSADGPFD